MYASPKQGVLLVNLGTPDEPTAAAIKRFLSEFLHDHRVVNLSRWLWCPLLHGIILPIRAPKVAKLYQMVWMDEGSPLMVHSRQQVIKLQNQLQRDNINMPVALGMTYGNPSLATGIEQLQQQGVEEIIVLPLYPQYSGTTSAAVSDGLTKAFKTMPVLPSYRFVRDYHNHPLYITALANRVRDHWQAHGQSDYLLCSYHGIPKRLADEGDIYPQHCEVTTQLLAKELGLDEQQIGMTYQSRFGREEWLTPYTDKTLAQLPEKNIKSIAIIAPAFSVDCLETLEEISQQCKEIFIDAGGEQFHYIPCLNANDDHIDMMMNIIKTVC